MKSPATGAVVGAAARVIVTVPLVAATVLMVSGTVAADTSKAVAAFGLPVPPATVTTTL